MSEVSRIVTAMDSRRVSPRIAMIAAFVGASLAWTPTSARAAECPGNPDAMGTSRILVVDPTEHTRIGAMQYAETLPLKDREVVLTFDDGPLPPHSTQVLDILAAECIKATFFLIGRMAHEFPEHVRHLRGAGHTIGTHSQNHPLGFDRLPLERAVQEIDDGIANTAAALGDPDGIAPFFRVPGLRRAQHIEDYLASRGIMTWSADFPADDWRHISPDRVVSLALSRIEAKGKGVLLLHDIQGRTVVALPAILRELKQRGYRIVHVVPATPQRPRTPTDPVEWLLRPPPTGPSAVNWPAVPRFVFTATESTFVPSVADAGMDGHSDFFETRLSGQLHPAGARLGRRASSLWPKAVRVLSTSSVLGLPVPAEALFGVTTETNPKMRPESGFARGPGAASVTGAPTETFKTQAPMPGSFAIPPAVLSR